MQVWVRNAGSASPYDAWAGTSIFRVAVDPLGAPSLSSDAVFPVPANTPVTWRASVAGGVPSLRYQFFVLRSGVGWSLLQDYSTVPIAVWTPPATGTYVVQLTVRNAGTTTGYDTYTNSGYITVGSDSPARIVTIGSDVHLPAQAGARITWTAIATGGTAGPLQFQFVRLNELTGVWTVVQPVLQQQPVRVEYRGSRCWKLCDSGLDQERGIFSRVRRLGNDRIFHTSVASCDHSEVQIAAHAWSALFSACCAVAAASRD